VFLLVPAHPGTGSPRQRAVKQLLLLLLSDYDVILASRTYMALAAFILIMTSFTTELATPSVMDVRYGTLLRLIYKDVYLRTFQCLIYLSFNQLPVVVAQILPSASGAFVLGKKSMVNLSQ